jgi:chaperonin GroES
MRIRPLGDRVVVQRCVAEAVSPGGIIIPDNAKNPPQEGIVLAVGPGTLLVNDAGDEKYRPVDVAIGDKVIFLKFIGVEYAGPEGEKLVILHESDIIAVYNRD